MVRQQAAGSVTQHAQRRGVLCQLHLTALQRGLPAALEQAVQAASQLPIRCGTVLLVHETKRCQCAGQALQL